MMGFFRKVAPWLATGAQFIPGAGPMIAGTINQIAGTHNVTLPKGKVDASIESLSEAVAAMTGNAAALADLQSKDREFQKQMQELGFQELKDLEALENADRASARAREVDLAKANARDHVPAVLALAVTAGFFITLWWIFVHGVNKEVHDLAMAMVGTLGTAWMGVVMYYFGSSKGSDDKTRLLGDIAKS